VSGFGNHSDGALIPVEGPSVMKIPANIGRNVDGEQTASPWM
jgi:hypothetical protein